MINETAITGGATKAGEFALSNFFAHPVAIILVVIAVLVVLIFLLVRVIGNTDTWLQNILWNITIHTLIFLVTFIALIFANAGEAQIIKVLAR